MPLNFADERYVRLYVRDTVTWRRWDWRARGLWCLLLRVVDRAGVLDLGDDPDESLAAILDCDLDAARAALEQWLARGSVRITDGALVVPNFVAAQETPQSDRMRQAESRAKRRSRALGVTPCHAESRSVTPSVPSVLSLEDACLPASETPRAQAGRQFDDSTSESDPGEPLAAHVAAEPAPPHAAGTGSGSPHAVGAVADLEELCRVELKPLCASRAAVRWDRIAAVFEAACRDPQAQVHRFAEHWGGVPGGLRKPLQAAQRWCSAECLRAPDRRPLTPAEREAEAEASRRRRAEDARRVEAQREAESAEEARRRRDQEDELARVASVVDALAEAEWLRLRDAAIAGADPFEASYWRRTAGRSGAPSLRKRVYELAKENVVKGGSR